MPDAEYCLRAKEYSQSVRNESFYKEWVHRLLESPEAKGSKVETVIELGCGSGFSTEIFEGYFSPNRYFAVDLSEGMLEIARSKFDHKNIEFIKSPAESTNLATGTAQRVVSNFAFHWFDTDPALTEIQRLLAPKGRALLVIPTVSGERSNENGNVLLRRSFLRFMRKKRLARRTSIGMSLESLSHSIERAGLRIVSCKRVDLVESFETEEALWSTLDIRGSLSAIFGSDRSDLDLPTGAGVPVLFNWRVMNLILEKT